jgi:hypothetical protein
MNSWLRLLTEYADPKYQWRSLIESNERSPLI